MATPVITNITPADSWVLVASSVKNGKLIKANKAKSYLHTYVDAGAAAPTGLTVSRQWAGNCLKIESTYFIDVYVRCVGDTGSVLVEL